MSIYNFDGTVSIDSNQIASSSSDYRTIGIAGDTLRIVTPRTPSSASDTGNAGESCWDSSYVYVCTAANTWKRAALNTW